ncbi:hypothetical protein [Mycolicibacterium psychrotolerans]|uniref:Transmembrane protein n=1 Tax=Mycolicibacterium psychrotolerans TaxID=216929 RepID=A0A7I7M973_9MYCO|nr:hypothetical protein [Mycolicibacterium psychrotolerans]BBX68751.1 hypothetical protein MPSYJ_22120 [Mycolicibacterium psychrotolerans]
MEDITPADARAALTAVDRARTRVVDEVGLPRWYWWLLAAGWLGLGVIGDLGAPWLAVAATVAFGVAHATVASRRLDGRRRTARLQVSADTAGRRLPVVVIGMLVVLVAVTIAAGFALEADGARHPGIGAGLLVAVIVGLGGDGMLRALRRRVRA